MGGSKARGAGFRHKLDPALVYVAFNGGENFMVFRCQRWEFHLWFVCNIEFAV